MRAVLVFVIVLCLSGCSDIQRYFTTGEVSWALKRELRDKRATQVELAKLTKFEWDELYLFGPYFPSSDVCKSLELSALECKSAITVASTDDGEMLLVFRLKKKIVHTEIHLRGYGDFVPALSEKSLRQPFTPQTAIFFVSLEGKDTNGAGGLILRPVPVRSDGTPAPLP